MVRRSGAVIIDITNNVTYYEHQVIHLDKNMSNTKVISKTDEYGNVWVMVEAGKKQQSLNVSECHNRPSDFFEDTVKKAIESKAITKGRYTASGVTQLVGLNQESKATINAVANALRIMGFESKRVGSGRFFVIE